MATTYLEQIPGPLLEDILFGRCLPFVGAGFSLNAHTPEGISIPDWEGLGKLAAGALPEQPYSSALEALSAYSDEFSRSKLIEFIGNSLHLDVAQPGPAHDAFCAMPFETVVTTNFDMLLEKGYARVPQHCLPLLSEDQLPIAFERTGVRLLKPHGDIHHPQGMVVTEEDYDAFLARNPLFATYISSLLIANTPLFVGYSLEDPDFRQIWQLVKERLGRLRRPAYVLQVDAPPHLVARYERRGVKVINLKKAPRASYGETITQAFDEIREYWTHAIRQRSTATEGEPQTELSMPKDYTSRLCYFSVPHRLASFYKSQVYPIAQRYGFAPVMTADVISPGQSLLAKTYALLEKAAVVVADLSTETAVNEIRWLQSRDIFDPLIIAIAEEDSPAQQLPPDLILVFRKPVPEDTDGEFLDSIDSVFAEASERIEPRKEDEPERLLKKREYASAVISAFSLLERELRERFAQTEFLRPYRMSLGRMLQEALTSEILRPQDANALRRDLHLRNELVHHGNRVVSAQEAREVTKRVIAAARRVRDSLPPQLASR